MIPAGYNVKSFPRKDRRGGGLAVIYSQSLASNVSFQPTKYISFEGVEFSLKGTKRKDKKLLLLYRTEHSDTISSAAPFIAEFEEYLATVNAEPDDFIALGDFNLHYDEPGSFYVNKCLAILNSFSLDQKVQSAAHRSGHILDWVVVRNYSDADQYIHHLDVEDLVISDHFFLSFTLEFFKKHHP